MYPARVSKAPRGRATTSRRQLVGIACALLATLSSGAARAEKSSLPPEVGYDYGDVMTPRATAMSGAVRAVGMPTDGLFMNPANMAAVRVYHIGLIGAIWPEARRQSYGAAAVDSIGSSTRLAGGLGGTWNSQDADGIDRQYKDLRFGLALPFGDQFFMGVGGQYLWLQQNGRGPLGDSAATAGRRDSDIVKGFSFDVGATLKPSRAFGISIVGTHLTDPGTGFQPTTVGGGIGVGSDVFTLEGDVVADFTTWEDTALRAMIGGEVLVADKVSLRAGYRFDQGADSHGVSGGFGYIDRAFDLELGVRRVVSGDPATAVVFGFRYHLEASGLTPGPTDG